MSAHRQQALFSVLAKMAATTMSCCWAENRPVSNWQKNKDVSGSSRSLLLSSERDRLHHENEVMKRSTESLLLFHSPMAPYSLYSVLLLTRTTRALFPFIVHFFWISPHSIPDVVHFVFGTRAHTECHLGLKQKNVPGSLLISSLLRCHGDIHKTGMLVGAPPWNANAF